MGIARKTWLTGTAALAVSLLASPIDAANDYSTSFLTIATLTYYSLAEPIYPTFEGVVEVYFTQPIAWTAQTSCSKNAVVIRGTDEPLVSAVQVALATNRPIRLFVDDSQQLSGICYLRAVEY